jgi:hypothetical protein
MQWDARVDVPSHRIYIVFLLSSGLQFAIWLCVVHMVLF